VSIGYIRKTNSHLLGLWRCLQLSLANKTIILIETQRMQNPTTIVVSLEVGQEELKIPRKAVGHGNHKGVSAGIIAIGRVEMVILNADHRYRWNR
jgi:hypothetical protein